MPRMRTRVCWQLEMVLLLVSVLSTLGSVMAIKPGLCEVDTGQSSIILDMEESRDTQLNQATSPAELPIVGDPFSEIVLELVFPKGLPLFILNGKKLQLLKPLDRDEENLSHIVFQLTCTVVATNKKRTIPVIIRVSDINDNPPVFVKTPYHTSVSEGSYQTSVLEVSRTNLERQGSYQTSILEVSRTNLERQGSYQTRVSEVSLTNLERQGSYQTSVSEGSYQTSVSEMSLTNLERQGSYQTSVLEVSRTNLERQGSYQTSVSEVSLTNLERQGSYQTSVSEVSLTNLERQGSYQTNVSEVSLTNLERQGSYQTSVLEVSLTNLERQGSYQNRVLELTPVGTTIFQGVQAEDPDAGVNGQVDYHVVPGDGVGLGLDGGVGRDRLNVADGAGFFSINLPHQGQVTVNRSLDYEKTQRYLVTIVASVSTVFPSGSDEII
uniref:Cadherin domain-containing protein n=1 Tax=Timema monikensis TaxID=170555 RepID=A0A7R9E438_9NEOP|nr:unnamed protein product [Timema monikensis]